jgi:hypothetical protein
MRHTPTRLEKAWDALDLQEQAYYKASLDGKTFLEVGREFKVNEEFAKAICEYASDTFENELYDELELTREVFLKNPTITFYDFCKLMKADRDYPALALLVEACANPTLANLPRLHRDQIYELSLDAHKDLYVKLVKTAPISLAHFKAMVGTSDAAAYKDLVERHGDLELDESFGIIRKRARVRDRTQIILETRGQSVSSEELASINKLNVRALDAQLLRDDRFARNAVDSTWQLKVWGLNPISKITASDALELVLTSSGSLPQVELIRRAQGLYPKSYSRYVQALEGEKFGVLVDGKYDLASRGAIQYMPPEPKTKPFIRETTSRKLIFKMAVSGDMLRGSGFPVDRRITWCAGMLQPTKSRAFHLPDWPGKALTLSRVPGNSSLSSIRTFLEAMGLQKGCQIQILLNLQDDPAFLRASCVCHKLI